MTDVQTSNQSTLERLQSEAARLQRELEAAEKEQPTDSRGSRDLRERIGKLTDDYRQTLRAIREIEKGATPAAMPKPPSLIKTGKMEVIGPEGQQAPEMATPEQAAFDYRAAQDELARERQKTMDRIATEKLTADEAHRHLTAFREGLALRLQQSAQALTARNQDLDAATASEGHRLSFAASQARGSESLASAMLPYLSPVGSNARMDHVIKHGTMDGAPVVQPMPAPYDPATFGAGVAQQALANTPQMILGAGATPANVPSVADAYERALRDHQAQILRNAPPSAMVLGG
jgi:hypothetical protein